MEYTLKSIELDRVTILSRIPHGPHALLLDSASLDPGRSVSAVFSCNGSESFLVDHYPNEPIVPGSVLVEVFGQTGAVLCSSIGCLHESIGYLVGIERMRIRKYTVPPSKLIVHVELDRIRLSTVWMKCSAYNDMNVSIADAIITVAFVGKKK